MDSQEGLCAEAGGELTARPPIGLLDRLLERKVRLSEQLANVDNAIEALRLDASLETTYQSLRAADRY